VHRFYIAPQNWKPDELILSGSEAHHARDVLRLKRGEKIVVFNGRGREITAEIVDVEKSAMKLRKLHETETAPLPCRIALVQAIPKGKNMELIVQKAVELGAAEIFPIISERTIIDLDQEEAAQKEAKWQVVAIEAAKQCGQNWLPQVHAPQKLKQFFETAGNASAANTPAPLQLIGSLQPGALHLKKILLDHSTEHGRPPASVRMFIGPEGDFTPAELALARSHGCLPITLGPIVLRVETAAIYCLSVLAYELF